MAAGDLAFQLLQGLRREMKCDVVSESIPKLEATWVKVAEGKGEVRSNCAPRSTVESWTLKIEMAT
jgi:hypothetical protein